MDYLLAVRDGNPAKRGVRRILTRDDYTGKLRLNCHGLAVRFGKADLGEWYLLLPTHLRWRGRAPSVKLLGFGVLWDRRPGRVRRFHWLRPHFDNREVVFMQVLNAALAMGYTRPNYG